MAKLGKLLIVDDIEVNRAILQSLFEEEYDILEAENGLQAMEIIGREQSAISAMLLDIVMPKMDGYQVLEAMGNQGVLSAIPVVVITSESTAENELKAFEYGAAEIITKPFEPHLVQRRVSNLVQLYRHKLHLEELVEEQAMRLEATNEAITDALSSLIEYRSTESGQHILRIRTFTRLLLQRVGEMCPEYDLDLQKINLIARASAMHDIGKIAIPDSILNKPGKLTAQEFEIMKTHSSKGAEILSGLSWISDREYLQYAYNICLYHHERWDGRGYPDGLMGDNIPLCAQVVGICDAYDALTSHRVYKPALPHVKAVNMILNGECGVFSPRLLECFKSVLEEFQALAQEYADGRSPRNDFLPRAGLRPAAGMLEDPNQMAQFKYFTLLRYLNAMVVEADLDTGVYHLIDSPDNALPKIKNEDLLEPAFRQFVSQNVHPEDREAILTCSPEQAKLLFRDGVTQYSQECRLKTEGDGEYRRFRFTLLKVNTGIPKQNHALMVWKDISTHPGVDEGLSRQQHQFLEALQECYRAVYLADLTGNRQTVLKPAGGRIGLQEYPQRYSETVEHTRQFVHPDDRDLFTREYSLENMRAHFARCSHMAVRFRYCGTDGQYDWITARTVRTLSAPGGLTVCTFILREQSYDVVPPLVTAGEPDLPLSAGLAPSDLQLLADNVPGGMFRCLFDASLTLLQVNEGFLSLLGYSREELRTRFHNSFWEMIDSRDRDAALAEVRRQLKFGPAKQVEYRMACKDGRTIWVLDEGQMVRLEDGRESFCCILVDITRTKEVQEELRLSLERHKIIMDQTNDIVVEWDILKDTFTYSFNWEKTFGYRPLTKNVSTSLASSSHIHPDDQPPFREMLLKLKQGAPYAELEFRLKRTATSYLWCRLRFTAQKDESGRPLKAVGVIQDIDKERRQKEELQNVALKDSLTGLYNKGAVQKLIGERMAKADSKECSALIMIDMDDFKLINDSMGHLYGDAFLVDAAAEIKKQFRSTDVVGRIGGDEFLVYMDGIPEPRVAARKSQQILDALAALARERKLTRVSCSIGYSLFPAQGQVLPELYRKADLALYQAKAQGKNRFVEFCPTSAPALPGGASPRTAIGAKIDSDQETGQVAETVFRLLYQSPDVEAAVNALLEYVGNRFDVSRAYIFENTEDDLYCCNTFEWCSPGVRSEKEFLSRVSYEDMGGNYPENFNEQGIFYCQDIDVLPPAQAEILRVQGIKSALQCAIYDGGRFKGFVGFDECRENRYWVQEQVNALTLVAEILSTFLLKKRAQDRALQTVEALETVLDTQNAWIYVIDPETYELLYINKKTQDLAPASRVGMGCYQAFFRRDSACTHCPARALQGGVDNYTMEVYNPIFRVWSSADASCISWKGQEAILLCCHDITEYKADAKNQS